MIATMQSGHKVIHCRSYPQFCSLGLLPPRVPGRSDAQVPMDRSRGRTRHARFPCAYFYSQVATDDPMFGFVDLEVSLQRIAEGHVEFELYCVGDGYQSGTGRGDGTPLRIEVCCGERVVVGIDWRYPHVHTGRMDPMTYQLRLEIPDAEFDAADRIRLPSVDAECISHLD